ncbi:glycosyltransferase [Variovorax sp. KK3]|uniref:glycosyltransferase n=1 Tax=Variovorax sp. KK3 TaxID=1855728 RepID=UPI0009F827D0|nr:glycosyltransferase [Variovorax sp. KK3]
MKTREMRFHIHQVVETLEVGEELFWEPDRLAPPGRNAGHLALAYWLVKAIRPEVLVELGTTDGNAYAAYCQAVERFGLSTRCTAVDGRVAPGPNEAEAFAELRTFNDDHYSAFSEVEKSDFDAIRTRFASDVDAGGIDLLHIGDAQGCDLTHVFQAWKSALSDRAVVLLQGIQGGDAASGAAALWTALSREYPSFTFEHAGGLGVIGVGRAQAPLMQRLFELSQSPAASGIVRRLFAARGDSFRGQIRMLDLEHRIESLSAEIRRINQAPRHHDADTPPARDADAERLISAHARAQAAWSDERQRLAAESQRLGRTLSAQQQELAREIMQVRANEQRMRDELADAFRNSASWRITAPLRAATGVLRKLSGPRRAEVDVSGPGAPVEAASTAAASPGDPRAAMRAVFATRLKVFLTSSGTLKLPAHPAPDVSILMVLYNQAELTFACLSSIAEVTNGSSLGVEVVIVDNGSSDATAQLLDRVEGARIIRSPENLHFLRGANRAARDARGKHLLFLNNDALLMPGALETAVHACDADTGIGAIGGRIVLPDGTLQEAGSIVWQDGNCIGYGRGGQPDAPEFMYRRDVDYCSGAFLLTPRKLYESLGGFDERYAPAYYEETDYCLRLWEAGKRVVFDPGIVILHHEFGSSSTSEQAIELQRRNAEIFRERHAAWLAHQSPADAANLVVARAARNDARRLLFIEDRVPHAKLGAGYPRSNALLREVAAAGMQTTLFPMFRHAETWDGIRRSVPDSIEVMHGYDAGGLKAFLQERRGYYDAILVCRPHNMQEFLAATRDRPDLLGNARVFYDAEALFASRKLIERELAGEPVAAAEAQQMIADEISLTRSADAIISVSPREKSQFEAHGVGPVFILSHSVDAVPTVTPFDDRTDLLFVGAIHDDTAPNADSLRWFADEIWPHLKQELGQDVQLKVVGLNRAESVSKLDGHGLELVGLVDDLRAWFEKARVVVAPTRVAAGIPLKVYEAAAAGVPTVVTDLLAAQTGWEAGKDFLAASSPAAFAAACARLYREPQLWEAVRRSALQRVTHDCSRERFKNTVAQLLSLVPQRSAVAPASREAGAPAGPKSSSSQPHPTASMVSASLPDAGLHFKRQ